MNNISIIGDNCCGCRGCEQVCPTAAIEFHENEEGFLYPRIIEEQCNTMRQMSEDLPHTKLTCFNDMQTGYGAKIENASALKKSSSGGLSHAFALHIINQGGYVAGCAYDDNLVPKHIIVDNLSALNRLQGSKYVQSDIGNVYTEIKKLLDNGKVVLFYGVPCQIAGLRNYLNKDYDRLYCVDIICHGVPSRKLFANYLSWLGDKYNGKVIKYEFRSKHKHQWSLTLNAEIEKHNGKIITVEKMASLDPYYFNFLAGTTYRESCYSCPYSQKHRTGDITIGDFWGVEKQYPELFDLDGVSCALINTPKGERLWNDSAHLFSMSRVSTDSIINNNGNLRAPTKRPAVRDFIYVNVNERGFDAIDYPLSSKTKIIERCKDAVPNRIRQRIKSLLK